MRRRWCQLVAVLLWGAAAVAQAQGYPAKPVKFIVPYPPGGIADTFSRALADQLAERLAQPVIPENKPGGSLIVGTSAAAQAPADGYTLLLGSISSLAINVGAFRKLPYDPVKDFAPVSLVFYTPLLLVTSREVQAKSLREFIALAKAKPGTITFASLGYGSSLHLAAEMFKTMAGIDIVHVPYKGTTTALPDLISGRVHMIFDGGAFLPHVKSGKLNLLAVTSPKRLDSLPDIPTMAEAVPGYDVVIWFSVMAPAGTPRPVVERLQREIAAIVRQPAFKARFLEGGIEPVSSSPEELAELIRKDTQKWTKLLRDAGVQPE